MSKASRPTQAMIDDVLNECMEHEDKGTTKFRGMTYEQGVQNGIRWVLGEVFDHPMED
jgi:hypothetical protein